MLFGLGAAYCRPKAAAMAKNWSGGSSRRKDSGPKGALCCSAKVTSSTPAIATVSDLEVERGVRASIELSIVALSAAVRPELKTVSGLGLGASSASSELSDKLLEVGLSLAPLVPTQA